MRRCFSKMVMALILCMSMLLSCVSAYAADEIYDAGKYKKINQSYREFNEKETVEVSYSDEMLLTDANILSGDIAKLAVNLALLSYSDFQIGTKINESAMGYNFTLYNYDAASEATFENNDKVAFSIGHKTITSGGTTYNAYIVPIRGTNKREWYSNFNIGNRNDGYHDGFKKAADEVLNTVKSKASGTSNNIFLITGHSRGAAVANIVAAELTNDVNLAPANRIFGYTFACPAVKRNISGNYSNIINFNNPGDAIVALPLEDWGFKRYGQDITLPISSTTYDAFEQRYSELNGTAYNGATDTTAYVATIKKQAATLGDYNTSDNLFLIDGAAALLAGTFADDISKIASKHNKNNILPLLGVVNSDLFGLFNSDSSKNAHKPTTYVLWINSMYHGYKGWYGLSGTADTDITLNNTSVIDSICFENCTRVRNVTVPDTVVQIGENAFKGASGLTQIVFEGTDTQIYDSADTIPSTVTIVAHNNSVAAKYANKHGRTITSLCDSNWDSGVVTAEATCTTDGEKTYTCTACNATKSETINKLGHSYGAWTKLDDTQHQRVCAHDSNHKETENHDWDSGVVTTEATCTTEGEKTYTCTACNATKTEGIDINSTAHKYGAWKKLNDTQHKRVCENDSSHEEIENHQWLIENTEVPKCLVSYDEHYKCTDCEATKTVRINVNPPCIVEQVPQVGQIFIVDDNQYEVMTVDNTVSYGNVKLIKAKNVKNVRVPDAITLRDGKSYKVSSIGTDAFSGKRIKKVTLGVNIDKIEKNAFRKSRVTTLIVKSRYLTKKSLKCSLKGSKIKTVKVKVGSKKLNMKYVKKYKKIFTKKITGRKVTVK